MKSAPVDAGPVPPPRRLLDQVRDAIRYRHFNYRTEPDHVEWVRGFVLFHGRRHPRELGGDEVIAFLSYLATGHRYVSTTMVHTHVLNRGGRGVVSPIDRS